ncbi:MAG: L,D-transpeptidase family protein [Pyrinomonadaceae bacterium]|nr:L,D-transpeptidase family protein [Pyrinomonadaceae bacterium]
MKVFLICLTFGALVLTANYRGFSQTRRPLPPMENPHLVIKKNKRLLRIYDGEKLVRQYKIALGFAAQGGKEIEGDGKTPEGEFYVFTKNDQSKFYLSLGLSYPNVEAAKRGWRQKIISREERDAIIKAIDEKRMPPQKTALGGEIYIHGGGTSDDWTAGCIALVNEEIKEIFDAIPIGAKVKISP